MAWTPTLRTWHRRLSLVVGLQLLAWTVSGLVFSWDPIAVVRGETSVAEAPERIAPPLADLRSPAQVADALGVGAVRGVSLQSLRGRWTWRLTSGPEGLTTLADAATGASLAPMTAEEARALAAERFLPEGAPVRVELVTVSGGEYRAKPVPAWRVGFDDADAHNLYLDALTGETTAVRNDTWRRFDWMWMLHIMDYSERTDFSTPWLKAVAALGVLTAASGLTLGVLLVIGRRRRRPEPAA
jgi:hypothetical protein